MRNGHARRELGADAEGREPLAASEPGSRGVPPTNCHGYARAVSSFTRRFRAGRRTLNGRLRTGTDPGNPTV